MAIQTAVEARFRKRVKKQRDRRGWSQADVAKMLGDKGIKGIYPTTVAKIESGERAVRIDEATALADLFETRLDVETSLTQLLERRFLARQLLLQLGNRSGRRFIVRRVAQRGASMELRGFGLGPGRFSHEVFVRALPVSRHRELVRARQVGRPALVREPLREPHAEVHPATAGVGARLDLREQEPDLFDDEMRMQVEAMLEDAIACETLFAQDVLSGGVAGLSVTDMRQYLEYCADQRLVQLDMPKKYGSKNPFDFMDLQDVQELTNFFERRVSSYQVGVEGEVAFDQSF